MSDSPRFRPDEQADDRDSRLRNGVRADFDPLDAEPDKEFERLSAQSSRLRRRLERNVDGLKNQAQQLTDWKHYVREYPLAAATAGVLLGFLLVPRSSSVARLKPVIAKAVRDVERPAPEVKDPEPAPRSTMELVAESLLQSALAFTAHRVLEGAWNQFGPHGVKAPPAPSEGGEI